MDTNRLERILLKYIVIIALVALAIINFDVITGLFSIIWSSATPLLIGAALAYILNLILVRVEKIYFPKSTSRFIIASRRPISVLASIVFVLLIFYFVTLLVIPELGRAIVTLLELLPGAIETAFVFVSNLFENLDTLPPVIAEALQELTVNSDTIMMEAVNYLSKGLSGVLNSALSISSGLVSLLFDSVITIFFAIFLLFSKEKIISQCKRFSDAFMTKDISQKTYAVAHVTNTCFSRFIVGQCTEALILGVLCTLGMTVLGLPFAPMVGALVGATQLVPIVGGYIGGGIGAFIIFTSNPIQALFFVLFLILLQIFEGNLIYPKVVGDSIGLPAMWVLFAVTIGGGLAGIVGMLLAVPLTATVYTLMGLIIKARLGEEDEETEEASTEVKKA